MVWFRCILLSINPETEDSSQLLTDTDLAREAQRRRSRFDLPWLWNVFNQPSWPFIAGYVLIQRPFCFTNPPYKFVRSESLNNDDAAICKAGKQLICKALARNETVISSSTLVDLSLSGHFVRQEQRGSSTENYLPSIAATIDKYQMGFAIFRCVLTVSNNLFVLR